MKLKQLSNNIQTKDDNYIEEFISYLILLIDI